MNVPNATNPAASTTSGTGPTTGTTSGSTGGATAASAQLMNNYQDFLTLLTAQLTHQDPTQPMDSSQFTNQLVQFSSVEQAIATNSNLQQLITLTQSDQNSSMVGYIGQKITAQGQTATLANGKASWNYTMPSGATAATITITNSAGKSVFTASGDASAGTHTFNWNGTSTQGTPEPAGQYQINIAATNSAGQPVTASTTLSGTVTGAEINGTTPTLLIGNFSVPLSDVQSIGAVPASTSS